MTENAPTRSGRFALCRRYARAAGRAAAATRGRLPGDVPFALELERPCDLSSGEHVLEIVVDGDLCVVNLDRSVILSTRIYDHGEGRLGLFVGEGGVTFSELAIRTRAEA